MPRKKKETPAKQDELKKKTEESKSEYSQEIFEIQKGGEEKTVETQNKEFVNEKPSENIVKQENKTLRNFLIGLAVLTIAFIAMYFFMNSFKTFEYKGVTFHVVKEIAPYQTSIPVMYQGIPKDYNFYLRNDPRELENLSFKGKINFKPTAVINATNDLKCGGNGVIAIANLANLYKILGTEIIKNQSISCDVNGTYMYLDLVKSNESKIEQYGTACYRLSIKDCEILEVTEKFMIESMARAKDLTNY